MTTIVRNGVFRSPSGFKVGAESYASLEATANALRPGLPMRRGEKFRLNCLTIFEVTLPKIGFAYRTVEIDEVEECAGFTMPGVVVLREDVYDKLHRDQAYGRSTVVHEFAHVALRHHQKLHRGAVPGQHEFFRDTEWQAKALTAALMMPAEAARVARSPEELAEMCGTSTEAAGYRIKNLVGKLKLLTPTHELFEYGLG